VKISIVDYGAGNLPSVERAFGVLGVETERAADPQQIATAKILVLPGVGHFSAFVAGLRDRNLTPAIRQAFVSGVPVLGICLGLQAMFDSSEEAPSEPGLGFLAGEVRSLPRELKSPHIGWNQVVRAKPGKLLCGIPENAHFYFAHSFAAPAAPEHTSGTCDHGFRFAAVIEFQNLFAVQFHPEKSGSAGSGVLKNFLQAVR
jgi:imidazole glycerol phosphate synthase glutamine amidotransferase subunit